MVGLAALILIASDWVRTPIQSQFEGGTALAVRTLSTRMSKPKISPFGKWKFDLTSIGSIASSDADLDRIRVFAQENAVNTVLDSGKAATFLTKLFDFNFNGLRLDHTPEFNHQRVDVYLCSEGDAGGQQRFGDDPDEQDQYGNSTKVNTMYLFQAQSLTDSVEACRELAHEYGHATLPPVKIPGGREEWANGHLGERIYLSYVWRQLKAGKLGPADTLGATESDLDGYLSRKVDPIVTELITKGPNKDLLTKKSDAAFSAYLALACYSFDTLPLDVFRRSLLLNSNESALGYYDSLLEAMAEKQTVLPRRPRRLPSAEYWIPVGKGKVLGAKVLESRSGWSKIKVTGVLKLQFPVPK